MNKPLILQTVRAWEANRFTPDAGKIEISERQCSPPFVDVRAGLPDKPEDTSGVFFELQAEPTKSLQIWISADGLGNAYAFLDESDPEIEAQTFPAPASPDELTVKLSQIADLFMRTLIFESALDEWAFDTGGTYDFVKVEEFCGHAAHEDMRDRQWTFFNYKWPDSSNVEVVGGFDGLGSAATFYEPDDERVSGFVDFDDRTHGLQNAQQFRAWLDKAVGRPQTMDIKSIGVSNLFGKLSYRIPLKTAEGVTIIHAPNGCGKTTILHLVLSLLKGEFAALCQIRFDSLDLEFGDGRKLLVEQVRELVDPKVAGAEERRRRRSLWRSGSGSISEDSGNAVKSISAKLLDNDGKLLEEDSISVEPSGMRSRMRARNSAARIVLRTPHLRLHGQAVVDSVSGEFLSFEEVVERYSPPSTGDAKRWLVRLLARNGARLIRTQRLDARVVLDRDSIREEPETIPAVVKDSQELADAIKATLAEFSNKSQKLDEDFLKRLLLPESGGPMSEEGLAAALADVSEKYDRVAEAGILAGGAGNRIPDLPHGATKDPTITKALGLYINNQREKLQVFDELLRKVETLKDLVNDRFQMKRLRVSPNTGYNVVSDDDESPIPLDRLSSGEQHQLVLFYSLVFGMSPGALIMIDEPEISLHVAWQEVFLRDLEKIAQSTGVHFLIATHSPVIIGARWNLTVGLGEQIPEA
jgi:ABC-type transport system involved in cytochrome c biogenesis ATPase subunit